MSVHIVLQETECSQQLITLRREIHQLTERNGTIAGFVNDRGILSAITTVARRFWTSLNAGRRPAVPKNTKGSNIIERGAR
jgi:hypothetical protein